MKDDMPKLYIANASQQVHQFNYWLPETPRHLTIEVPIGGQIVVGNKDLPREVVDGIIAQHRQYGLCTPQEGIRDPRFSGLCYSIDKPVSYTQLYELANKRRMILMEQGKKAREEAAIATDVAINDTMQQNQMPGRLNELEMSVEEVSRGQGIEGPEISEGVRVTHKPNEQLDSAMRNRRRPNSRSQRATLQ